MSQNTLYHKTLRIKPYRRDSRVNHCSSLLGEDDVNLAPCDSVMNNTVEGEGEREKGGTQTQLRVDRTRVGGSYIFKT